MSLIALTASQTPLELSLKMANRHGLIAGATGTGKTVSLQVLAEAFSRAGVPVFMADVKGDLSGLAKAGGGHPKIAERVQRLGLSGHRFESFPVVFWDVFGENGHPARSTVSEMGPVLLSRLMQLNDTQSAVLTLVFRVADDRGLLLLDLNDLRAMVQHCVEQASELKAAYGHLSPASLGAIQRGILVLEERGAAKLFGEPALNLEDFIQTRDGRGVINILHAEKLLHSPVVYSIFLLWLLSELFENLPEAGDLEKPKLVFFFDEAHLLFSDAPRALLEKIEQVVRLIRSRGVGVYFVTQNPLDIPETVLGQLGNRVQHALRAFTPKDQKAVKTAAQTFRQNPSLDVEQAITELGVGEALISFLDEQGVPAPAQRAWVAPPSSQVGVLSPAERKQAIESSVVYGYYEKTVDRESAFELLARKVQPAVASHSRPAPPPESSVRRTGRQPDSLMEAAAKSAARSIGSQLGRQIVRGILGSILTRR